MTQLVSIPAHHFIGNGDTPFLIVGRVWGDDDDTATLIMADNLSEAYALFVEALHESAGNTRKIGTKCRGSRFRPHHHHYTPLT
ncbi:Uncharacterised protein [Ectopseudomonas oleovorans]|uniref:Uncharacterized protein n=1 Tax=Ectopseudomonas oleovorans TaxID=301 RepID=A0A379PML7_ECTOL|nr:hypothetical protein [Pseudomonas oleovorans]SUE72332.1 Uncharacterised protein [Pseudomonas oleovorans]